MAINLIFDQMTACTMLDKKTVSDGYGGVMTTWTDGAKFQAYCRLDSSMEARVAEKQGVTSLYTVITPDSIHLQYHDIFRRNEDGKIFRVSSDGDDFKAPGSASAGMKLNYVTAEEWAVPNG